MAPTKQLRAGDRVRVPRGLGHANGTLREVYGPPQARRALVDVDVVGADGEVLEHQTVSYALDEISA
jgi:hypothetical protein